MIAMNRSSIATSCSSSRSRSAFFPAISFYTMQMYSLQLLAIGTVWALAEIPLATVAGAWLYQE